MSHQTKRCTLKVCAIMKTEEQYKAVYLVDYLHTYLKHFGVAETLKSDIEINGTEMTFKLLMKRKFNLNRIKKVLLGEMLSVKKAELGTKEFLTITEAQYEL